MILLYVAGLLGGTPSPRALVDSATRAMHAPSITSLRIVGMQHDFILGNAERAEGPWRTVYSRFTEMRKPSDGMMWRQGQPFTPGWPAATVILRDSVIVLVDSSGQHGGQRSTYEDAIDRLSASPERALTLAAASPNLHLAGAAHHYGLDFDVVEMPYRNGVMRIELERSTHLPYYVEIRRQYPHDFRRGPFGTVKLRFEYVDWRIQPNGAWWPMQHKVSFNGEPLRDVTIDTLTVNDTASARATFTVSDSARAEFIANHGRAPDLFKLGATGPSTELRPGIVRVPDYWSMTIVKNDDGFLIFEAHLSGAYLREVIGEAHRRFPGARLSGIVMTSDPWAHLGGVRDAATLGVPIYVNARSVPFLSGLTGSTRFVPVSQHTELGHGANRLVLYPVGGAYGERMLMAYFPEHRLLYGADLVFPNQDPDGKTIPGFDPTPAFDLRQAVERDHLAVDSVFCVQRYGPFSWKDFTAPTP